MVSIHAKARGSFQPYPENQGVGGDDLDLQGPLGVPKEHRITRLCRKTLIAQ
jgi:hypothetical protein